MKCTADAELEKKNKIGVLASGSATHKETKKVVEAPTVLDNPEDYTLNPGSWVSLHSLA